MSAAPDQSQLGLETQPSRPVRQWLDPSRRLRATHLPKVLRVQPAAFDEALECANGDCLAAVHGDDYLSAVRVTPLLMAAFLPNQAETMPPQHTDNLLRVADREALAHGSATSKTFAPAGIGCGDGSNQSSSASLALATACSSVSPAEAQPGNSGKKAAQRFVSGSYSTTSRNPIRVTLALANGSGKGFGG